MSACMYVYSDIESRRRGIMLAPTILVVCPPLETSYSLCIPFRLAHTRIGEAPCRLVSSTTCFYCLRRSFAQTSTQPNHNKNNTHTARTGHTYILRTVGTARKGQTSLLWHYHSFVRSTQLIKKSSVYVYTYPTIVPRFVRSSHKSSRQKHQAE